MLTLNEARTRVALGAAYLDAVRPGWDGLLNVELLAMESCGRCVLGQVFGDFEHAPVVIESIRINGRFYRQHDSSLPVCYGFVAAPFDWAGVPDPYEILQQAWIELLAARVVETRVSETQACETQACETQACETQACEQELVAV